jgi:hypothetical protein
MPASQAHQQRRYMAIANRLRASIRSHPARLWRCKDERESQKAGNIGTDGWLLQIRHNPEHTEHPPVDGHEPNWSARLKSEKSAREKVASQGASTRPGGIAAYD